MSFTDGRDVDIVGSAAQRAVQYAADIDGYEVVRVKGKRQQAVTHLANQFGEIIKRVRAMKDVFISDIKAGAIPEFDILGSAHIDSNGRVVEYDAAKSRAAVDRLEKSGVLTAGEASRARGYLKDSLDASQFLVANQELRYQVQRWTPTEVVRGFKRLRNGADYTLEQAFTSPARTKLDVIAWIAPRFIEFSLIYEFKVNGVTVNPYEEDPRESISSDIAAYAETGNTIKALKRLFSLAKIDNNQSLMSAILNVLNGDAGRLYALSSDIGTLSEVVGDDMGQMSDIKSELDSFRGRFASIWNTPAFIKAEPTLLRRLSDILRGKSRSDMARKLQSLKAEIDALIEKSLQAHSLSKH